MIDESESEEDRRLLSSHFVITEPNAFSMKQSLFNHNSVSINRTFTPLPIKLEIQTTLDKAICSSNLHPDREKHSLDMRKGFSSITITTRRYIASLSNAPKEITNDPASSLCRSNDLLMKASVSSDEHDQQCRYLCNRERYSQTFKPVGFLHSQEFPCHPGMISNTDANQRYLKDSYNIKNHTMFISGVYIKRDQTFPGTIYYVDRFFTIPLGQYHAANQRMYKSTLSFKIKCPPARPANACSRKTVMFPRFVFYQYHTHLDTEEKKESSRDEYQPLNPSCELQYTQYKALQGIREQQNRYQHDPCQDVSNYLDMKAFDLPQILKKDSLPLCEIYAQKDSSLQGFSHLRAERSTITTFNFIFGKQISHLEKNKQILQKKNITLKGHKWNKSCGNIGSYDKENMAVPELTENNKSREFSQELMTLQEALEHHKPDFICNSQERVHKLELMAQRRKIQKQDLQKSTLQKHPPTSTNLRRKVFTIPHPLSG